MFVVEDGQATRELDMDLAGLVLLSGAGALMVWLLGPRRGGQGSARVGRRERD